MNSDGFEEMLFSFPSSQDAPDGAWDDASEDDMLEVVLDSEPPSWILRSSPDQLPSRLERDPDAMMLQDLEGNGLGTRFPQAGLDDGLRNVRLRTYKNR